jgi:hypothetical protein
VTHLGRTCATPGCGEFIKTSRQKGVWVASVIDGGGFPKEKWFCCEDCLCKFASYRIHNFKKCLVNVVKRGDESVVNGAADMPIEESTSNTQQPKTKN